MLALPLLQLLFELVLLLPDEVILKMVEIVVFVHAPSCSIDSVARPRNVRHLIGSGLRGVPVETHLVIPLDRRGIRSFS